MQRFFSLLLYKNGRIADVTKENFFKYYETGRPIKYDGLKGNCEMYVQVVRAA